MTRFETKNLGEQPNVALWLHSGEMTRRHNLDATGTVSNREID